jgi:hypothetical protein
MKKACKVLKYQFSLFLLCVLAGFACSCSRTEPKIAYGFMELVYYQRDEKPEERFSFFVIPEDDDGIENLGELYLYHDREGLRWLLSPEDWVRVDENGKTWIGSRSIAVPEDESLPRGQYRAVLINKSGERTERLFTFDAPRDPRYPFPFVSVSEGRYRIDSQYPVNRFICYDQQGNILQTVSPPDIEGSIQDLKLSNSVRSLALWAEDTEYHTSSLTEAAAVR